MDFYVGMVLAALTFLASLISIELGLSAAIIEIALGVIAGNFLGVMQLTWVKYIAGFGGILLTFLAGAEVDLRVMRQKAKASFLIGTLSFAAPFVGTMLLCRHLLHWGWPSAQLAGIVPTFFAQRFFHPQHALEVLGSEIEPERLETMEPDLNRAADGR
jgi:Kef-type K+ transport system membrane component KefB